MAEVMTLKRELFIEHSVGHTEFSKLVNNVPEAVLPRRLIMKRTALILLGCVLVLAGLAGCADTGKVVKQEGVTGAPTLQILHLSDLHIGKATGERPNLNVIVNKTMNTWGGAQSKPLVIITGDISNDGKVDQFEEARGFLDPLYKAGFQLLIIPGNHDYGPVGILVQPHRFETFKNRFYPDPEVDFPLKTEIKGHVLIGLNSMEGHEHGIDVLLADGKLGPAQINKTVEILDNVKNRDKKQKIIVYLHHHPFLYPGQSPAYNAEEVIGHRLDDDQAFMEAISGRVDILLFGHEHWHLDFTGTDVSTKYGIPIILSAGRSTNEKQVEYKVDHEGVADHNARLNEGLLGRLITIQEDGTVKVETVKF
jgi:predicted MPP superfamily phosphohydrolase